MEPPVQNGVVEGLLATIVAAAAWLTKRKIVEVDQHLESTDKLVATITGDYVSHETMRYELDKLDERLEKSLEKLQDSLDKIVDILMKENREHRHAVR